MSRAAGLVLAALCGLPVAASAQSYGPPRGRFEIGAGAVLTMGYDAGSRDAELTRNPSGGTSPLTLFQTTSRVQPGSGARAHLGVFVAPRVSLEGTVQYARSTLRTTITGDFESAADTQADDPLTSYLVGGSVLYHFGGRRVVPFISGGGAYLRQLHDGNGVLLSGTEAHVGGGVTVGLGTRIGLRMDAGISSRNRSVSFEEKRRTIPTFAAGLSYRF